MTRKVEFYEFEEARRSSGLFFERLLIELDITERTYYRWKQCGQVPYWAMRIVELLSGDLSAHGWRHWRITGGVLTTDQLNPRYHRWTPGKLLQEIYGHGAAMTQGIAANDPQGPQLPVFAAQSTGTGNVTPLGALLD